MLLLQRLDARHPLPPLGPPPKHLSKQERRAWLDIVAVTPAAGALLRVTDQPAVLFAAVDLARWREGHRDEIRDVYRGFGRLFIPMRDRRRLLFPKRRSRR